MNNYNFAQQGWQCPLCKRVYSPFTPCCFHCGAEGMTKTASSVSYLHPDSITKSDMPI